MFQFSKLCEVFQRSQSWRMGDGDVVRLNLRQRATLRLLRGSAWVTRDGDPIDYVLSQGEEIQFCGRGVVVQALGDAIIRTFESGTRGQYYVSPSRRRAVQLAAT